MNRTKSPCSVQCLLIIDGAAHLAQVAAAAARGGCRGGRRHGRRVERAGRGVVRREHGRGRRLARGERHHLPEEVRDGAAGGGGGGVARGGRRLRGQILALVLLLLLLRVVLLLLLVVAVVVVVRVVVVVEGLLHLKGSRGARNEIGRRGTPFRHWHDSNVQGNRGLFWERIH